MQQKKIDFSSTGSFSQLFLDYLSGADQLRSFYGSTPTIENFASSIENRNFPETNREVLYTVLRDQYADLQLSEPVESNIARIRESKTFTVTTGHQLNLFTGPMYFIYKIVTVIRTCKLLAEAYPDYHFIPCYWMASEDHDFEEIDHFHLFGKTYRWSSEQSGAVGRFDPAELEPLLRDFPYEVDFFKEAYLNSKTLADACRKYVDQLFGAYGLLVIDGDDPKLKALFRAVMEADIISSKPFEWVISQTQKLEKSGYEPQINCREINFFYLDSGRRERIERSGENFMLVDSEEEITPEVMTELIQNQPEKLSPNVVTRPLYQETILPNLAYVGGPAELAYWLQLKAAFDHLSIPYPILMPRNFALLVRTPQKRKWSKTGFDWEVLFEKTSQIEKKWLEIHADESLSFGEEVDRVSTVFEDMKSKARQIDTTLLEHLSALETKVIRKVNDAEQKLVRNAKRKYNDRLNQIRDVKETLFPNGQLQERHDNFLNFYLDNPTFISMLMEHFDPLDFRFLLLLEDE